jgi:hypothetical protein
VSGAVVCAVAITTVLNAIAKNIEQARIRVTVKASITPMPFVTQ